MEIRTPDKLLKFVSETEKRAKTPAELVDPGDMDDDEPVRMARASLNRAYAKLADAEAQDPVDENKVILWRRACKNPAETFESARRGANDAAKNLGELVSKADALTAAANIATNFAKSMMASAATSRITSSISIPSSGFELSRRHFAPPSRKRSSSETGISTWRSARLGLISPRLIKRRTVW